MFSDVSNGNGSSAVQTNAVVRKHVYTVTERNEKSFWTKIGMAFQNRDGSFTVRLDAVPINGVLQIRDEDFNARNRDDAQAQGRSRSGGAQ